MIWYRKYQNHHHHQWRLHNYNTHWWLHHIIRIYMYGYFTWLTTMRPSYHVACAWISQLGCYTEMYLQRETKILLFCVWQLIRKHRYVGHRVKITSKWATQRQTEQNFTLRSQVEPFSWAVTNILLHCNKLRKTLTGVWLKKKI